MTNLVEYDIVKAFNALSKRNKALVYDLIERLTPDGSEETASPDDIAAYEAALDDLKHGECIPRSAFS